MSDKDEFQYREKFAAEEAADYLNRLAEGLRQRSLRLQGQGQAMLLIPENIVKLKVKAACKEDKGKLELTISWKSKYAPKVNRLDISTASAAETENAGVESALGERPKSKSKNKVTGASNEQ